VIEPSAGAAEPVLAIEPAAVEVRRLLVLKLDHRGDFIMATPGFAALRAAFPAARITLACGDWNRGEAEATGLFDEVLGSRFFPEFPDAGSWLAGDEASRLAFAGLLAGERFDLAVDLRLHGDTRPLLRLVDATVRAGFDPTGAFPFLDIVLPFGDEAGRSLLRRLPAARFETALGARDAAGGIVFAAPVEAAPGEVLIYGPYEPLEAGEWDVAFDLAPLGAPFVLGFDVTAAGETLGGGVLAVTPERPPRFVLRVAAPVRDAEIRLVAGPSGPVPPFRFAGAAARRHGRFTGPHQAEMQYLLCCLVGLRLRHFWRATEAEA
jgi:hypothetical protein